MGSAVGWCMAHVDDAPGDPEHDRMYGRSGATEIDRLPGSIRRP